MGQSMNATTIVASFVASFPAFLPVFSKRFLRERMHPICRDVLGRFKNELPVQHFDVRNGQRGQFDDAVFIEQDVDVQCSCPPAFGANPSEVGFNFLEDFDQFHRR